jgi:hypothetical protein
MTRPIPMMPSRPLAERRSPRVLRVQHCGAATACSLLLLAGCASPPPAGAGVVGGNAGSAIPGRENGLEVRQWVIADEQRVLPEILVRHLADDAAAPAIDPEMQERLRRNGLRLLAVPATALNDIAAELPMLSVDRSAWHGQVHEWRELHALEVDPDGLAVAIDGRVRRFDRGSLRLLSRSWTVPMEDGPRMLLEIVPQHEIPVSTMRRLLNQSAAPAGRRAWNGDAPTAFGSVAVNMLMEHGWAYVLTCDSPAAVWPGEDRDRRAEQPRPTPQRDRASIGPEAEPPPTLGELLLSGSAGRRALLVFVPRIAPGLLRERPLDDDPPQHARSGKR